MRLAIVLLVLASASRLVAQQPSEVKLVVQQGGREIGQEESSLTRGRGRGPVGSSIRATARYPASNPIQRISATLERTSESALSKFQLEVDGPNGPTVILAAGSGARLIIRTLAKGTEAGRELPGGPDVVLLDENVFSLYLAVADLATPSGRSLTAVFPRTARRASFVARREPGGLVNLDGGIRGSLETDAKGLVSLALLESGIRVSRAKD